MANASSLDVVRATLDAHKRSILDTYGALGVAIGQGDSPDHPYVIVVYLASEPDRPSEPVVVGGVPLRFEVTGEIRPLDM